MIAKLLGLDWHNHGEEENRLPVADAETMSPNSSYSFVTVQLQFQQQSSSLVAPFFLSCRVVCFLSIVTVLSTRNMRWNFPVGSVSGLFSPTSGLLGSILSALRSKLRHFGSFPDLFSSVRDPLGSIPGPWSVPVIGSLVFFLRRNWFQTLADLRRKYGDIYRLQIGSRPVVVLCGRRAVEGALTGSQSHVFAGRPALRTFRLASEGKSMSFNGYSAEWKIHRRLADRVVRAMYTNKSFVESCLSVEAQHLRNLFLGQAERGTPYNPDEDLLWSVAHVQYSLCYGNSHHDDSFQDMVTNTIRLIGCHNKGNVVDFFPWAGRLLRFREGALERICDTMLSVTKEKHAEHQRTFTRGRIRDILDALLEFGVNRPCPLDESQVVLTVQEFIGAGLDIVHAALHWTVLYASRYPEVQRAIHDEILRVIGAERTPARNDMHQMPYTMAFIAEVLRHSSVVPLALPHSTTRDTYLDGHFIPANTFVLVNLQSVNHDQETWEKPEIFRPERFLETQPDGTFLFRGCNSVFGFGWRQCVGAELSRLEIFLYLTTLLQSCMVSLAPEAMERDLDEPRLGIVLRPKPFFVLVTPR